MTYTTCSSQAEQVEVRLVPDVEVQEPASPRPCSAKGNAVKEGSYEPAGPGRESPAKAERAEGTWGP